MVKGEWSKVYEELINIQISNELHAFYEYYNMSLYFSKGGVGLDKLSTYFKKMSDEEKDHADKLCEYQIKRGGEVILLDIKEPEFNIDNNDILDAFEKSLSMEKKIYSNLLEMYSHAENDPHFASFIESVFLDEQITAIYDLNKIISNIKRIGNNNIWEFINTFEG